METELRDEKVARARDHGYWDTPAYFGTLGIHCEGDILADDSGNYMQKRLELITALLPHPHLGYKVSGTFYLDFEGIDEELHSEGTMESWELPLRALQPARGNFLLNFKSKDPRMYGDQQSRNVYASSPPVGRSYNKTYDKTYVGSGAPIEVVVTNSGNVETWPILEMYGPGSSPEFRFHNPDGSFGYVRVNVILPTTNDFVTVDVKQRTAIKNDGTDVYGAMTSDVLHPLEPGDTLITYGGFATFAPAQGIIKWNNAYILG
jgi:hypothetical protein